MAAQRGTAVLLLGMAGWIALALAGAVVAAGAFGAGAFLLRGQLGSAVLPEPGQMTYILVGASGFQGALLLGAVSRGYRTGNGDWRAGLGIRRVRRKGR